MCFCNLNSQALGSMLRKLKGQTVCGAQGVARSGCDGSGPQQKTNGQYVYIYVCIYIYMCPSSTAPHLYLKTQRTSRVMRLPRIECTDARMLGKVLRVGTAVRFGGCWPGKHGWSGTGTHVPLLDVLTVVQIFLAF